jgi:hypothetical protein
VLALALVLVMMAVLLLFALGLVSVWVCWGMGIVMSKT